MALVDVLPEAHLASTAAAASAVSPGREGCVCGRAYHVDTVSPDEATNLIMHTSDYCAKLPAPLSPSPHPPPHPHHTLPCVHERLQLESSAAAQVSSAEATAAAACQSLRSKLEGRVASITACLAHLTAQEEAREAKRQELAAQVGGQGRPGGLLVT